MKTSNIYVIDDGRLKMESAGDQFSTLDASIAVFVGENRLDQLGKNRPDLAVASSADQADLRSRPGWSDVPLIVYGEAQDIEAALRLGAVDFLPLPVDGAVLSFSIRKALMFQKESSTNGEQHGQSGKIFTVYAPTGGVGKTMLSVNLAVSMAKHLGLKAALLDLDLQFPGDDLMLNITPARTIIDILPRVGRLDGEFLEGFLPHHASGLYVLPASIKPEDSERVAEHDIRDILGTLRSSGFNVVIDSSTSLSDNMLAALDMSDRVILLTTLELLPLRNTRSCLEILNSLGYSRSNIDMVLNRSTSKDLGINIEDAEELLGAKFIARIPSSGEIVVAAANRGQPFTLSQPEAEISRIIIDLARRMIFGENGGKKEEPAAEKSILLKKARRLFS